MKHGVSLLFAVFVLGSSTLAPSFAQQGQTAATKTQTPAAFAPNTEGRTARALYVEASEYAPNKFREFAEKKVPFDPKLLEKTLQEQREMAARFATTLAARIGLPGEDFYFVGMLYNLAENNEKALEALKKFLAITPTPQGAQAQAARYVITQIATKVGRLEEAEAALAAYAAHEPQQPAERVTMEKELATAYRQLKQPARATPHAEEAFKAAKLVQPTADNLSARDYSLYTAGLILVNLYVETNKTAEAITALEEIRKLALAGTSPRLYADATSRLSEILVDVGRKADGVKMVEDALAYVNTTVKDGTLKRNLLFGLDRKRRQLRLRGEIAPDISATNWIDQKPFKLADMRGQVVLLDFWATWCGPCLLAFPHLRGWYEKYKDRGLLIVGLTQYYGTAGGRRVEPAEELTFVQKFKRDHKLPYGIAVAEGEENMQAYGLTSIPTAVLIDRHGIVRLITTGAGSGSADEIAAVLERLIQEQ